MAHVQQNDPRLAILGTEPRALASGPGFQNIFFSICSRINSTCSPFGVGSLLALFSGSLLVAAVEYFTPQHQLLGIGAGRSAMTARAPAPLAPDRMIQSQTFTIMRDPNALIGAERITSPRPGPIFRRAETKADGPCHCWKRSRIWKAGATPRPPARLARAASCNSLRQRRAPPDCVSCASRVPNYHFHRSCGAANPSRPIRLSHRAPQNALHRHRQRRPLESRTRRTRRRSLSGAHGNQIRWHATGPSSRITAAKAVRRICFLSPKRAVHHQTADRRRNVLRRQPRAARRTLSGACSAKCSATIRPPTGSASSAPRSCWRCIKRTRQPFANSPKSTRIRSIRSAAQADRLKVWLKSHDIFYRSPDDLRLASGKALARVLDDPKFFGFSLPEMAEGPDRELYLQDSPAAIGTLLYVAFETRRLFEDLNPKGERFVPLQVAELVGTTDRPPKPARCWWIRNFRNIPPVRFSILTVRTCRAASGNA